MYSSEASKIKFSECSHYNSIPQVIRWSEKKRMTWNEVEWRGKSKWTWGGNEATWIKMQKEWAKSDGHEINEDGYDDKNVLMNWEMKWNECLNELSE